MVHLPHKARPGLRIPQTMARCGREHRHSSAQRAGGRGHLPAETPGGGSNLGTQKTSFLAINRTPAPEFTARYSTHGCPSCRNRPFPELAWSYLQADPRSSLFVVFFKEREKKNSPHNTCSQSLQLLIYLYKTVIRNKKCPPSSPPPSPSQPSPPRSLPLLAQCIRLPLTGSY